MAFLFRLLLTLVIAGSFMVGRAQNSPDSLLIAPSLLESHVRALAHDSMQGRATGSAGLDIALAYMQVAMAAVGLEQLPEVAPGWLHYWDNGEWQSHNVVGQITGHDSTRFIVFSSHLDHVGSATDAAKGFGRFNRTTAQDKLFNGANDNASGTAALLALAAFFRDQPKPKYTLLFIAFTGEELGLLGSKAFCMLPLAHRVVQNINLEMLGRPGPQEPFITENDANSDLRKDLNNVLAKEGYGKRFFKKDGYVQEGLFARSDNNSFAEIGVPANTIMGSSPRDRYYHHVDDEWETLDYNRMAYILTALIRGSRPLIMEGRF